MIGKLKFWRKKHTEKIRKETADTTIRDIKYLFRLEKKNKAIKDIILINFRNFFDLEEGEHYYNPVIGYNFLVKHLQ